MMMVACPTPLLRQHPLYRCGSVGRTVAIDVPRVGQRGGNLAERKRPALSPTARQLVRELDHFRPVFGVATPAADLLARLSALAVARRLHLRDERRLLELRDGAEHLAPTTAVGVSSAKKSGALVGTSATPRPFR